MLSSLALKLWMEIDLTDGQQPPIGCGKILV